MTLFLYFFGILIFQQFQLRPIGKGKKEKEPETFYELKQSFSLHTWQEKNPHILYFIRDQIMGKSFPTFHSPFFSF